MSASSGSSRVRSVGNVINTYTAKQVKTPEEDVMHDYIEVCHLLLSRKQGVEFLDFPERSQSGHGAVNSLRLISGTFTFTS